MDRLVCISPLAESYHPFESGARLGGISLMIALQPVLKVMEFSTERTEARSIEEGLSFVLPAIECVDISGKLASTPTVESGEVCCRIANLQITPVDNAGDAMIVRVEQDVLAVEVGVNQDRGIRLRKAMPCIEYPTTSFDKASRELIHYRIETLQRDLAHLRDAVALNGSSTRYCLINREAVERSESRRERGSNRRHHLGATLDASGWHTLDLPIDRKGTREVRSGSTDVSKVWHHNTEQRRKLRKKRSFKSKLTLHLLSLRQTTEPSSIDFVHGKVPALIEEVNAPPGKLLALLGKKHLNGADIGEQFAADRGCHRL